MTILVKNCFHWIGYHIVDQLLKEGYQVIGLDQSPTKKSEHLSMFFARHEGFSLSKLDNENVFNTAIIINSPHSNDTINSPHQINIEEANHLMVEQPKGIYIKQPLVFGEWMPIVNGGINYLNRHIRFDSEEFIKHAIYISDFSKMVTQLLEKGNITTPLNVKYGKLEQSSSVILDNTIHIRDNTSIESKIKKVLAHYKQFKDYY